MIRNETARTIKRKKAIKKFEPSKLSKLIERIGSIVVNTISIKGIKNEIPINAKNNNIP